MPDAGYLSLAEAALATTLANSATFRTEVGAANPTEALAKIIRNSSDELDPDFDRPRALIHDTGADSLTRVASSGWQQEGVFELDLEFPVPTAYADADGNLVIAHLEDANHDFKNKLGQIVNEMCDVVNARTAGCLIITNFRGNGRAFVPKTNEDKKDFYGASYLVHWKGGSS